jgi:ectoine hydroxylase-related dioxygenase (phytanoyl-CoA dioxygenase family)
MRNIKEMPAYLTAPPVVARSSVSQSRATEVEALASELDTNGIVILPNLIGAEQLRDMQRAFESRLRRMRWNNCEGYQKTEPFRHMIEDVLMLDQGFVDLALHPLVKQILTRYMGTKYELTEAKGWKSLPTKRDFHGWHADSWYDKSIAQEIHREVKLAVYLTDVRSGAFNFIKGSHRKRHPCDLTRAEVANLPLAELVEVNGGAGTVFMFDSSAIHRQGSPLLQSRQAVFFAYHDPSVPLQDEDVRYYRYHPLLLNAAFLGDLSDDDRRILGFGNKTNFQPAFERSDRPPLLYRPFSASFSAQIRMRRLQSKMLARLKRVFRMV